jgi:hypothetical protein
MYLYVIMSRPKKDEPLRKRLSITIHPDLAKWVKENTGSVINNKPFRSTSDLIEQAILLLKEKMKSKK